MRRMTALLLLVLALPAYAKEAAPAAPDPGAGATGDASDG